MKLTELEGATLGLLWLRGSATAYELRAMVADSPTPHWSASAGTIYPLVRKLSKSRLIALSSTGDGRHTRRLRITGSGMRAFKKWIRDCSPAVIGPPPDPVRTRVRFIELLSTSEGRRLLEQFEEHLKIQFSLMRVGRRGANQVSLGESITLFGARVSQQSRVRWITAAKKRAKVSRRQQAARWRPR
jgi:DNA-binding PadR family transcriptional regulator